MSDPRATGLAVHARNRRQPEDNLTGRTGSGGLAGLIDGHGEIPDNGQLPVYVRIRAGRAEKKIDQVPLLACCFQILSITKITQEYRKSELKKQRQIQSRPEFQTVRARRVLSHAHPSLYIGRSLVAAASPALPPQATPRRIVDWPAMARPSRRQLLLATLCVAASLLGAQATGADARTAAGVYELRVGDFSVKVTNWGARLVSVVLPDSKGTCSSISSCCRLCNSACADVVRSGHCRWNPHPPIGNQSRLIKFRFVVLQGTWLMSSSARTPSLNTL
jgi:hypothetical protein